MVIAKRVSARGIGHVQTIRTRLQQQKSFQGCLSRCPDRHVGRGGIVQGILGIPGRMYNSAWEGDTEQLGRAAFDLATLVTPGAAAKGVTRIGSFIDDVRWASIGQKGNAVQRTLAGLDEVVGAPLVAFGQKTLRVGGYVKDYFVTSGKAIASLASRKFREESAEAAATVVQRLTEEGYVISKRAETTLGHMVTILRGVGTIADPRREWNGVKTIAMAVDVSTADGINTVTALAKRFLASQAKGQSLDQIKQMFPAAVAKEIISYSQKLNQVQLNLHKLKGQLTSRDSLVAFQQLETLLTKHRYNVPKIWNNTVDRLLGIGTDINKFEEFLNIPFLTETHAEAMKVIYQELLTMGGEASGLKPGELIALSARGTGGASLAQINTRASRVGAIYSGDLFATYNQFFSYRSTFRTMSDLFKTPMDTLSDLDLNISVRGGTSRLMQLDHDVRNVRFPIGDASLHYGGVVQDIVNIIQNKLEGKLRTDMIEFIGNKGFAKNGKLKTTPVEIYYQDTWEFGAWSSTADVTRPTLKGAVSIYKSGDDLKFAVSKSSQFENLPKNYSWIGGAASSLFNLQVGYGYKEPSGFLHSHDGNLAYQPYTYRLNGIVVSDWDRTPQGIYLPKLRFNSDLGLGSSANSLEEAILDLLWFVSQRYIELGLPSADVQISTASLPPGQLAVAFRDGELRNASGQRRVQGEIVIDDDAAGNGWYVDDDPMTLEPSDGWKGRYDLLTVLAHELGHIYGFTNQDPRLLRGFAVLVIG